MMSTPKSKTVVKPRGLGARPQMDDAKAGELMALFKVLANENRLQLLHALERSTELSVGELADVAGMTVQAVSNQLQRLVDQRILVARREGNHAYYRIVDPCVVGLLELGICLIEENRQNANQRS